jgi:hypothetical protein
MNAEWTWFSLTEFAKMSSSLEGPSGYTKCRQFAGPKHRKSQKLSVTKLRRLFRGLSLCSLPKPFAPKGTTNAAAPKPETSYL